MRLTTECIDLLYFAQAKNAIWIEWFSLQFILSVSRDVTWWTAILHAYPHTSWVGVDRSLNLSFAFICSYACSCGYFLFCLCFGDKRHGSSILFSRLNCHYHQHLFCCMDGYWAQQHVTSLNYFMQCTYLSADGTARLATWDSDGFLLLWVNKTNQLKWPINQLLHMQKQTATYIVIKEISSVPGLCNMFEENNWLGDVFTINLLLLNRKKNTCIFLMFFYRFSSR